MKPTADRPEQLRLGKAVFNPATGQLCDDEGRPIAVRKKSLRVLCALAARNGQIIDRDDLIAATWDGRAVSDDSLVQCIKDLRAALGDRDRTILRTAVGRGYSLHGTREPVDWAGAHPRVLVARLEAVDGAESLAEVADALSEELVVAIAPRAGLVLTTDGSQRGTADYVIEGRVGRAQGQARIHLRLIRGAGGEVAFAETWTAPGTVTPALIRQITDKIASVLRIHMFNHAGADYLARDDQELDTQALMAKAAYHMSRIRMENRDIARAALAIAVKREPDNAMALAMRASAAVLSILQEPRAQLPDDPEYCLGLADRAMGLAPQVDFVNRTRGSLRLWFTGDHAGARADCERALQITPEFHLAHQTIALSEILSGERAAGIERLRRIIELGTTRNPRYPHYLAMQALGEVLAGREEAACATAREAHERAPQDPWCAYVYAAAAADRTPPREGKAVRRLAAGIDLPLSHFRDLAFTDPGDVEMLEDRLIRAGLGAE